MKYLIVFAAFLFISCAADAQVLGSSNLQDVKTAETETISEGVVQDSPEGKLLSREEIEALIKSEAPAVAMTAEEKAEIDAKAKKNMRSSVKKQSVRERKDFIDAMTSSEKVVARRKALLAGQGKAGAAQAEDNVKKPDINPSQDKEMENYLFEKAGLAQAESEAQSNGL